MDEDIAKLYEQAPRFDEGKIALGEEYHSAIDLQLQLYDLLLDTYGEQLKPALDKYTDALYMEMECEAQHFFQEGYRAAQSQQAH